MRVQSELEELKQKYSLQQKQLETEIKQHEKLKESTASVTDSLLLQMQRLSVNPGRKSIRGGNGFGLNKSSSAI